MLAAAARRNTSPHQIRSQISDNNLFTISIPTDDRRGGCWWWRTDCWAHSSQHSLVRRSTALRPWRSKKFYMRKLLIDIILWLLLLCYWASIHCYNWSIYYMLCKLTYLSSSGWYTTLEDTFAAGLASFCQWPVKTVFFPRKKPSRQK